MQERRRRRSSDSGLSGHSLMPPRCAVTCWRLWKAACVRRMRSTKRWARNRMPLGRFSKVPHADSLHPLSSSRCLWGTGTRRSVSAQRESMPGSFAATIFLRCCIMQYGYLNSRYRTPTRYKLNKPCSHVNHYPRSMKTCRNITTEIWPTMSVAKATRHSRLNPGCAFSLGLSTSSYCGQVRETSLDNQEVSR